LIKRAALLSFIGAITLQLAILGAIPARKVMTIARGREVTLQVQPVDPYSIMSGYYVVLSFSISRQSSFATPPELLPGSPCYAIVEKDADGIWKPVELAQDAPTYLPKNRAVLSGTFEQGNVIRYGIENFYIPESRREEIADDLRKNPDKAVVDVSVDENGGAVLRRLRIEQRVYE
jgi:uncharacterized membrane-anchored protein